MTKPKKPAAPRAPTYLDENPHQTQMIFWEDTSHPSIKETLADMIYNHAQKNNLLLDNYDWTTVRIETSTECDWETTYVLRVYCDVNIDPASLLKIQGHNRSLRVEYDAKVEAYMDKLKIYEAELACWNNTEAGQKASQAAELKRLRAKSNEVVDKLVTQFKSGKISPDQFLTKLSALTEATG